MGKKKSTEEKAPEPEAATPEPETAKETAPAPPPGKPTSENAPIAGAEQPLSQIPERMLVTDMRPHSRRKQAMVHPSLLEVSPATSPKDVPATPKRGRIDLSRAVPHTRRRPSKVQFPSGKQKLRGKGGRLK